MSSLTMLPATRNEQVADALIEHLHRVGARSRQLTTLANGNWPSTPVGAGFRRQVALDALARNVSLVALLEPPQGVRLTQRLSTRLCHHRRRGGKWRHLLVRAPGQRNEQHHRAGLSATRFLEQRLSSSFPPRKRPFDRSPCPSATSGPVDFNDQTGTGSAMSRAAHASPSVRRVRCRTILLFSDQFLFIRYAMFRRMHLEEPQVLMPGRKPLPNGATRSGGTPASSTSSRRRT